MLSQTAEYALRAAVYLAEFPERPHTIQEIAGPTKIPAGYLAKVLQELARRGILVSQRGLGGGFTLARPAAQLSIYDIVQAVDPIQRIYGCPLGNPAHAGELCPLHKRLDAAAEAIEESFRNTTLSELLARPTFAVSAK